MSVEVHSYRLDLHGTPAGRHVLRAREEGRQARLEGEASFDGALPSATVVQLSRCHRDRMTSYEFRERTRDRGGEHQLHVDFDGREGLVRLRRGANDVAETPYLLPFRDPLSMLRELRRAPEDLERLRIPMLGHDVVARALGEVDLGTELGARRARAWLLQPGGAWVWVDVEPPHPILKFTQRLEDRRLDALLVSIAQETRMPGWDAAEGRAPKPRRKGRRRRRRRGRGGGHRGEG